MTWPTATFPGELEPHGERLAIATFVSGAKVVRSGQDEVHWVDLTSVDLSTLCSGRAPLLVEHRFYIESFIGQVQEAWVSSTQRAHAIVRFADMPEAERLWQLLTQGFPLGISAGYTVGATEPFEDGFLIRDWRPYELSLVVRGADENAIIRCRPLHEIAELRDERRVERLAQERRARQSALKADEWKRWAGNSGADQIAEAIGVTPEQLHGPLLAAVEEHLQQLVQGT